ncbi:hypothetical protein TRVA0_068S00100 [Trichomonascus vanleenenianus]|uniref:uncharacterized protein n=1 Tax=Trichomonascus vanleenenianus TaxID=2268995 RepID=UPI003EC9869D
MLWVDNTRGTVSPSLSVPLWKSEGLTVYIYYESQFSSDLLVIKYEVLHTMVSKLSIVSLVLTIASALGQQQCTLSDSGQAVADAINTFVTANSALQQAITAFESQNTFANVVTLSNDLPTVAADLAAIAQALTSPESELTDCDLTTLIGLLSDAAPTFVTVLQSLSNDYHTFVSFNILPLMANGVQAVADNSVQLISTLYSSLPGCEYAAQAVDAMNGITAVVASVQQSYGLSSSASPTAPALCSISTTGGSTPTSPPTCKKQVGQENRAN